MIVLCFILNFILFKIHNDRNVGAVKIYSRLKKYNIDIAVFENNGSSSIGCLIRDENGAFIADCKSKLAGILDPKIAETLAFRKALSWLKNIHISQVFIELDSLSMIQNFHGKIKNSSYLDSIIHDCFVIVKYLRLCPIYFFRDKRM